MGYVWLVLVCTVITVASYFDQRVNGPIARARRRLAGGHRTIVADREIVTLTGTVVSYEKTFTAPIGAVECVAYRTHAGLVGAALGEEHLSYTETNLAPFLLETERDGMVLIEARTADIAFPPRRAPSNDEGQRAFLEQHRPGANPRAYIFYEVAIPVGSRVTVQGMAIVELDASSTEERGYRDDVPQRIRVVAHERTPLTIGPPRR